MSYNNKLMTFAIALLGVGAIALAGTLYPLSVAGGRGRDNSDCGCARLPGIQPLYTRCQLVGQDCGETGCYSTQTTQRDAKITWTHAASKEDALLERGVANNAAKRVT
ncbi:MAG: hypothetical protein KatS3mg022_0986 [Armatimonadota bacterium]|nr:MAG: hypothetical protein KatS3mg022_0986 [Armatimonadota bacterium]